MLLHRGSCTPRGAIVLGRRLKAIGNSQGAALRRTKAFKKYEGRKGEAFIGFNFAAKAPSENCYCIPGHMGWLAGRSRMLKGPERWIEMPTCG